MPRHIFIDNSNLFLGAQRACEERSPPEVWVSVRLYFRNLASLLEAGDIVHSRIMAGSVPPGNDQLWEHSKQLGYATDLLKRVDNDRGGSVEQGVDELLHLKIANALLDFDAPQTLVIATGDGAMSQYATGFVQQSERALKRGWDVEVWSWKSQTSFAFTRLGSRYAGKLTVKYLDDHYNSITFVKGGDYNIRGVSVKVGERVVSKLKK